MSFNSYQDLNSLILQLYQLFVSNHKEIEEESNTTTNNSLQEIPKVFFKEEFKIGEQLIEGTTTTNQTLLLQEKLSHYLDSVEVELIRQISLRRDSFFAALSNLQELHEEVQRTCLQLDYIRNCLLTLDNKMVKQALQVTNLRKKRDNLVSIYKKLELITTVKQTQQTIQLLLSTSDFAGAIDLITTTQDVLNNDLLGVLSFRHMNIQLHELLINIHNLIQVDFLKYSIPLESNNNNNNVGFDYKDNLIPLIIALIRLNKLQNTLYSYKDNLLIHFNNIFKSQLE